MNKVIARWFGLSSHYDLLRLAGGRFTIAKNGKIIRPIHKFGRPTARQYYDKAVWKQVGERP